MKNKELLFRSGPQLSPVQPETVRAATDEPPTACADYSLPQKIPADHYLPPSATSTLPAEETTRSQNLTRAAGRLQEDPGGLTAVRLPQRPPPPALHPLHLGQRGPPPPNLSAAAFPDLPAAFQGSIGGISTNGRPGGGGSNSEAGGDIPQHISFRHQQARRHKYITLMLWQDSHQNRMLTDPY